MTKHSGQWVKGQSGNPAGRPPRGHALADLLRVVGDELTGGVPNKLLAARALWEMAINGEVPATRLIYNRCEGLAQQSIELDQTITFVDDTNWSDTGEVNDPEDESPE